MFRIARNLVNISGSPPVVAAEESEAPVRSPQEAGPAAAAAAAEAEALALEEAEEIVAEARRQARRILEDAEAQAEELRGQASESGYAEGFAAGRADADAELEELQRRDAESVHGILAQIESERERIMDGLEAEIIDLVLSAVKKIINISAETDDKIFESMIAKALKQIKPEGRITIRVSSAEYEKYFSSGSAAFDLGGDIIGASVLPDPALGFFDCVIDSDSGTVNAGLDTQLGQIGRAFDEAKQYEDD